MPPPLPMERAVGKGSAKLSKKNRAQADAPFTAHFCNKISPKDSSEAVNKRVGY